MSVANRRAYRRLPARLPIRCTAQEGASVVSWQAVSRDVSAGGIYFESTHIKLETDQTVTLELFIPPGVGHFPYESKAISRSKVVRVDVLERDDKQAPTKVGVAARFLSQLKMEL